MVRRPRVALVHGTGFGTGGLAVQSANAAAALALAGELHTIGPAAHHWPRSGERPAFDAIDGPGRPSGWSRLPLVRRFQGRQQYVRDVSLGRFAAAHLDAVRPGICYLFTQVALEALQWCRRHGVPSVLDSPNGNLRAFRQVYLDEYRRWCGAAYRGHPLAAMVDRVEEEYALADRIRVSSEWARTSLVAGGVPASKISVLQQAVDLSAFAPPPVRQPAEGPLRVVFVGTLDMRKGFVYLLEGVRRLGEPVSLELVGGTVDRCARRLLARHVRELDVRIGAGDPRAAYHRAELSVLPTLEDGSPFAAAEAMASGLGLVVTGACGAREWVEEGRTGWVVPARDADAIASALNDAGRRRAELAAMGRDARAATERRADPAVCDRAVAEWVLRPLTGR
jgi:glycosyltransferase involved in cell wall biosynthesis